MTKRRLQHLLSRGDTVSIDSGKLIIVPGSGQSVPPVWLKEHGEALTLAILEAMGTDALVYLDYAAGTFMSGRGPGVQLRFASLRSGEDASVFFNVGLTRQRATSAGKKGTALPAGQFRVGKRSSFIKFWRQTGLPENCSAGCNVSC